MAMLEFFFCRIHTICWDGCWPLETALFCKLQSHEATACVCFQNSKVLSVMEIKCCSWIFKGSIMLWTVIFVVMHANRNWELIEFGGNFFFGSILHENFANSFCMVFEPSGLLSDVLKNQKLLQTFAKWFVVKFTSSLKFNDSTLLPILNFAHNYGSHLGQF